MKFLKNKVNGSFVISLDKISDKRGFFARLFCKNEFKKKILSLPFLKLIHLKVKKKVQSEDFITRLEEVRRQKL